MTNWSVTLRTGTSTWSTITVEAPDHVAAVRHARRLLGSHPVTRVV
jgi:hypothetical protein